MGTYLFPIKMAMISFPILAGFLTIPFAIYNYRKYGYVNKWRTFILFSFLLFLITAYYLVILPVPETRDIKSIQRPGTVHYNLKPFQFVRDTLKETRVNIKNPGTYKYLLGERAFLQGAFNVLLLFPLGVYLRYYFKKNLKETIIITFLVSLFFELTQLSGLYGYYNAPYRLFDIDDLFLNTLGGTIGYLITPIFLFFLPKAEEFDSMAGKSKYKISYFRRFLSFFIIDMFIITLIQDILKFFVKEDISFAISLLSYFTVLPFITNGRTVGNYLTNIRIKGKGEKLKIKEAFLRIFSFYTIFYGINYILNLINNINMEGEFSQYIAIIYIVIFSFNIFILLHFVYSALKKQKFFYERISNTEIVLGNTGKKDLQN